MDFINEIKTETLIVSNSNIKELFLDMHILKPIKFMNLHEFLSMYYFSYDEKTITYVAYKYNIKYDIAHEYIDNLYYIENKKYENTKLDFLVNLKQELDDNKLLIYHNDFKKYLKNIAVIFYDISMDDFLIRTLKEVNYTNVLPKYNKYNHQVYRFNTIDEEVEYVIKNITKLLYNGISPANIKLTNVGEEYYNTLERIASLYHLKINIPYKTKLSSYPLVKEFINLYLNDDSDINDILSKIECDNKIYVELVKVINKYLKYNDKLLLISKIENSEVTCSKYEEGIEIIDYLNYIPLDNEYIFMLSFNEGSIPRNNMDTDYITDNICHLVGKNTSIIKNKIIKEKTINIINNIKNLTITYKEKDYKKSYYPSTLIIDNYEVVNITNDYKNSFSSLSDKIKLVKAYDNYFKYGVKDEYFDILNSNYTINYNKFNNKYHKIDRVMDKLSLSYSKMQIYNKCAFRYYLSDILKLDIFEENFSTVIGQLVHFVMEKCLKNNDMNPDKYIYEFLIDKKFTKKEEFFLNKYKECIKELLDEVVLERDYSSFDNAMYEEKITINYDNNISFVGIIDKILYYIKDDITYISLIDYKTGNDNISLSLLKYGLDIQLPIYLYLSTKLPFNNIKYTGFYLQKFNIKDKDYRLVGYSNSDKDTLSIIDNNYDNSKIIKGLKTNKDGSFSKTSKVLSDSEIDKVKESAEKNIKEVIEKIKNNEFTINPKVNDGINIGCAYCKFKDICFKQVEDEVVIYSDNELE